MQSRGPIADVLEKEEDHNHHQQQQQHVQLQDSGSALQQFLDRIPISSIPALNNSHGHVVVLELKAGDTVKDAINVLYEKETFGAVIVDVVVSDSDHNINTDDHDHDHITNTAPTIKFSDRYIAFIHFARMLLWCLQEYEKIRENEADNQLHLKDIENNGFFSILDRIPQIGQTKVGELAKSFIWEPFFPVRLDDTILHALLLLSNHDRLHVLPLIHHHAAPPLIGFLTQNSLVQQLLQSSDLEWFDTIANMNLSQFRFEGQQHPSCVFADQSVADAFKLMWQNQTCAVAVVHRQTKKLIGNVRNIDVYNLLRNDDLLRNRMILTVEEFIHRETETEKTDTESTTDHLKNSFKSRMDSPITNKESDTLMQVMKHVTQTNSNFSFLVNDKEQVTGFLTLRDIILKFAPPCVNSSIGGGGFFEFALEQSGCQVKNGIMIRNRNH